MLQIERLRSEGVPVDDLGNLDLRQFGWNGEGGGITKSF
jgi:hypothetical protein